MTATRPRGLSGAEAQRRLVAEGRNDVGRGPSRSVLAAVLHQLGDTVILVLLAAAGMTAAVGDATDTAVILAVVVLNTAIGVGQEMRSGRALDALAALVAPRATVLRDGRPCEIEAAEVVRGDVVLLAAGDIVPADATVLSGEALQVDESTLTGESVPIGKREREELFAGTVVTRGRGEAEVTAIAGDTAVGRIARSLGRAGAGRTPVQRQLDQLGRLLAVTVAVVAVVVGAISLAAGRNLETSAVLAISLAVAAIPESLPAVVSLALAMAARRMSGRGILVRRLPAVEALGSVTVLAADKTGTLTVGRLTLAATWTPSGADPARLLEAGALCNDARRGVAEERDDPVEVALVEGAQAAGIDVPALRAAWPRLAEVPFDAAAARMSTTHRAPDGRRVEITKGAPEALLPAGSAGRAQALRLALAGHRVLAVTAAPPDGEPEVLGLVAFRDPPRPDAAETVAAFRRAGVRPVMITGDHPATARAVADAVGIDGDDDTAVHARVRPEQKSAIVTELRERGEIVAMTGDGVNDAPALHAADIGVSMGERATEVARQAADIVLTKDDLSAMIPAIAEGRRAYDNLRRFLHYALSGGLAEVLVMLFGGLVGFPVPLQAGQLLWVNLLTHGLPGVAMGNEDAAADVLRRPPRPPRARLVDHAVALRVALLGTTIAVGCLAVGVWADHAGRPWQSAIFVTLGVAQLFAALALRPVGARATSNPALGAAVAANLLLLLAAVWWAPLRELLHTDRLSPSTLAACGLAALPAAGVALLQRRTR